MAHATDTSSERTRLDDIAADSWYAKGVSGSSVRYSAVVLSRFWHGERCLELGPAEGEMTEALANAFPTLTLVEGAEAFCQSLRGRFPAANIVHSLFEEFETDEQFDVIVIGHVLEHVESPPVILRRLRKYLAPGGVICSVVPNARSIHRQAAVIMGLLANEHSLNETDRHHGHRRVYDPESLRAEFLSAGLKIRFFGGYWVKPLSNAQIDATWTSEMINAFMQLGERYPDVAAEICVVAGLD